MITVKKINKEKVCPVIPAPEQSGLKVKGCELFSNPYPNIFLCARKRSGKTSTIFHILKKCMLPTTTLIIFCSTVNKDQTYKEIRKYFERKGNDVITYTSTKEDGVDQLQVLLKYLEEGSEDSDSDSDDYKPKKESLMRFDESGDEDEKKEKSKYVPRDYICIFDDLSDRKSVV